MLKNSQKAGLTYIHIDKHLTGNRKNGKSGRSGVYSAEVTPVPIPNTEVKLCSADDTWREAAWESRTMPV